MSTPRSRIDGGDASRRAAPPPGAPALWIGAAVAAVVGTLLALAGARAFGPQPATPSVRRFVVPVPQLAADSAHPVRISPDGRWLLYPSGTRLMVRDLARFEPREVEGAEGARAFTWSPDSRRIAYCTESATIVVSDPTGERPVPICSLSDGASVSGADWGPDGTLVFARDLGGLYRVAAAGGEPRLFLAPDTSELCFHHPQFLPDGRHVLAVAQRKSGRNALIVVSYPGGARKNIGEFEHLETARYAPSGHLLLAYADGTEETRVVPFSTSSLAITGPPIVTLEGALDPSVSSDGTLCYILGASKRLAGDPTSGILLVENWALELGK